MQIDYDSALQAARERALFRHKGWCGGSVDGCTHWKEEEAAIDYALRLARAIGAAEACDHDHFSFESCHAADRVDAIIRELEG